MFKQTVVFGLSLALLSVLFSFYATWKSDIEFQLLNYVLGSVIVALVAGCGFALGLKITNHSFSNTHLAFAAIATLLLSNTLQNLLETQEMPWIIRMLVVFAVALLLSWRLPLVFKEEAAKKAQ